MSSPACLKRSYADTGLDEPYPDQITPSSSALTPAVAPKQNVLSSPSPANVHIPDGFTAASSSANPAVPDSSATQMEKSNKKVKLTYAEKEAERIEKQFNEQQKAQQKMKKEEEKEFREQQKAEEKIKKDMEKQFKEQQKAEEKIKKEEEKRIKEAEKEERKKVKEEQAKAREAEKQKKMEEKQKVEEEKSKKARVCQWIEFGIEILMVSQSQLRLNAFFIQPSMPHSTPRASPARDTASPSSSRRNSIAGNEMEISQEQSRTVSVTPQKAQLQYYERQFPPFFLQSHTVLAPQTRFSRDAKCLEYAQKKIDEGLGQGRKSAVSFSAQDLLHVSPHANQHFPRVHAVKDIIARMHGSARNPIDLTESQSQRAAQKPADLLKTVPMKYLKFFEDYRPPYTGTYTKVKERRLRSKLCRKPFSRELPNTNYDYDSEAEWEEPGEGEDLDSEGEEEIGEDEEENDMEGFLDDENDVVKKRPLLGDLEPTCSGICWEDLENEESKLANLDVLDLSHFKLDILMGMNLFARVHIKADTHRNSKTPY